MIARRTLTALLLLLLGILPATSAKAAEITGRVVNATTGSPAADVSVGLLALQQRMETVAQAVTDGEGRYTLTVDANPGQRYLVQASFQGVNYNAPVVTTGGTDTVNLTVYASGATLEDFTLSEHVIFLQPGNDQVQVTELFGLNNASNPPRSYAPDGPSFFFGTPRGARDVNVTVSTGSGIPLNQQPPESAENPSHLYLNYAFRPGEAQVQVTYSLPQSGDTFAMTLPLATPARGRFLVIPAAGIEFTSAGLEEQPQTISPDRKIYIVRESPNNQFALSLTIDKDELIAFANRTAASAAANSPGPAPDSNPVTLVPHPFNQTPRLFYLTGLILFVLTMGLYYLFSLDPSQTTDHDSSQSGATDAD
jgi:hypothetical protein